MSLAIEYGDFQVVNSVTCDHATFQALTNALFHGRHEYPGNDAALDGIDKLEAFTTAFRLNAQMDFAELPGPARLLLVAIHGLG